MKGIEHRRRGRGGIELIEEAVQVLRTAPGPALASYYVGSLPFVLGLLYFWADMSRSPFAGQHLARAALGVAALFAWMKYWQAVFARDLRAYLAGETPALLDFARCRRIFIAQAALQPTALFVLPLALVPVLPFGWVYAFYQNLTALGDGESAGLRELLKKSRQQATLWPRQNHLILAILLGFGFYVFLNWATVCFVLPGLLKMLFGLETAFTRSGLSLLNSTFFAVMFGLTYLCVDPIVKTVYALRCFYGQSLQSGEDLKAELRRFAITPAQMTAGLVIALTLAGAQFANAGWNERGSDGAHGMTRPATTQFASEGWGEGEVDIRAASGTRNGSELKHVALSISPPELDRAIEHTIQQRKYTWRAPREKVLESDTAEKGVIGRFLDRVRNMVRQWLVSLRDWLGEWLRKLFRSPRVQSEGGGSGYGWIMLLQILLYLLVAAVAAALAILVYRLWRDRHKTTAAIASEPIHPTPDLADEHVGADQLPEDGWTRLARELLARGELRLALRAFYLASLAHLAARNLISLAKFKSNRDYQRELQRRGHSLPDLLSSFGENVLVFDRIWYGLHEINGAIVDQFAANVERIKTGDA